jgi:hypothetical protein
MNEFFINQKLWRYSVSCQRFIVTLGLVLVVFNVGFRLDGGFQAAAQSLPFWEQAYPCTNPTPRNYAQIVYDEARDQIVLFGGVDSNQVRADTLVWDGSSWSKLNPPISPRARIKHRMVYDRQRQVIVLFGGNSGNSDGELFNDTWEWNGTSWTKREVSVAPIPRDSFELAYDSHRGVTVLFGGFAGAVAQVLGDTWEWDGTSWSERSSPTSVSARNSPMMAYDEERRLTILFGGFNQVRLGDTWAWDGSSWSPISSSVSPAPRNYGSLVFDSSLKRLILFGGLFSGILYASDTWELTSAGWKEITLGASPRPRCCGSLAYDRNRSELVLFGGDGGSGNLNNLGDTHIFSSKLTRPSCQGGTTVIDREVSLQETPPSPFTPTLTPTPAPSSSTTPVMFQPTLQVLTPTPSSNNDDIDSLVPGDVPPPSVVTPTPSRTPTIGPTITPTINIGTPNIVTATVTALTVVPTISETSLQTTLSFLTPAATALLSPTVFFPQVTPSSTIRLSTSDNSTIFMQARPTVTIAVQSQVSIPTPTSTPEPIPLPSPIPMPTLTSTTTPSPSPSSSPSLSVVSPKSSPTLVETMGVSVSVSVSPNVGVPYVPDYAVGRVMIAEEPLKGVFIFSEKLGSTVTQEDGTFRLGLPKNGLLLNEKLHLSRSGYLLSPEEIELEQLLNKGANISASLMSDHFKNCTIKDEVARKIRIDTNLRELEEHIFKLKRMFLFISSGQKFKGADIATRTVRSLLSTLSQSPEAYYSCQRSNSCISVSTATVAQDAGKVIKKLSRQLTVLADELIRIAKLARRERSRIKSFQKNKLHSVNRELKSLPRTSSFCTDLQ